MDVGSSTRKNHSNSLSKGKSSKLKLKSYSNLHYVATEPDIAQKKKKLTLNLLKTKQMKSSKSNLRLNPQLTTIKLKKDTNLQDKEIEEIKKLFLTLGQSDIESQQRLIDLTCENLKKLTSDSKEEILKKGSLYKKLITFIGICIGIILI